MTDFDPIAYNSKLFGFDEIASQLDPAVPLQLAHIRYMAHVASTGLRYSNEDYDVRLASRSVIGKSEIKPWNAGFVAKWTA